ncbi:MAG: helix-turn-helix domain-containing protein [Coprobacillaceae bacterium]
MEYLIDYRQTTLKELCEEYNFSVKTAWSDLQELNHMIHPVSIESDFNGIYLHIPATYSIRYIYSQLLKESKEYALIEYAFFHEAENLVEVADYLDVSEATLRRMITHVNEGLKEAGLKLSSSPLQLKGEPRRIFSFITFLLSEKYLYEEEYLPMRKLSILNQLFNSVNVIKSDYLNYPDYKKLRLWVYTRAIYYRIHQKEIHYDSINPRIPEIFSFTKNQVLYKQFEGVFGFELNENSIMFLFELFSKEHYALSYEGLLEIVEDNQQARKQRDQIIDILEQLSNIYEITLDNKEKLILDIYNMLQIKVVKPYIVYNRRQTFIKEISHHHLLFYQTTQKLIKQVFQEAGTDFVNEMIYIILTHWKGLTKKLEDKFQTISISVLMDTDIENTEMVIEILKQRTIYKIEEFIPSSLTLDSIVKEMPKVDMVVTNIPGLEELDSKVVCIQDYPTSADLIHILEAEDYIVRKRSNDTQK